MELNAAIIICYIEMFPHLWMTLDMIIILNIALYVNSYLYSCHLPSTIFTMLKYIITFFFVFLIKGPHKKH